MDSPLAYSVEMHSNSATFYFRGAMSIRGALQALRACHDLPAHIRTLCVNLHGVRIYDPMAVDAFVALLHDWRHVRAGLTRVELPPARVAQLMSVG